MLCWIAIGAQVLLVLMVLPFTLQALAILVDEFYFHRRRELPLWERVGHPLDTLSVLAAYAFLLLVEATPTSLLIYIAIAVFSCLFVTKDEVVHKDLCPKAELWLHAVLFALHPIVLSIAGAAWYLQQGDPIFQLLMNLLKVQIVFTGAFLIYQVIYWSVFWKKTK